MEDRYKLVICKIGDKCADVFEDTITGDSIGFDEYYHPIIVDLLNKQDKQLNSMARRQQSLIKIIRELENKNEQLKKELCNCEEDYILEEYL